ncbi:MAG: sugar phosphate isomerase/epimerase, partial [Steroidobacter sp.]
PSHARSFNKPFGIQLWSVRAELEKDFSGTLKRIAELGYREVEFAGYYNKTADEILSITRSFNLRCASTHHSGIDLQTRADEFIDYAAHLGVGYFICSSPAYPDPDRIKDLSWDDRMHSLTLDDWKMNAEFFNKLGEKVHKAGIQFGYHNHVVEFHHFGNVVAYEELIRLTDPALVKLELDCGWAAAGGFPPAELLKKLHGRVVALHLKDNKTNIVTEHTREVQTVALGKGVIDWPAVLREAEKAGVKHYFIEQEPPYLEPIFDSLKTSADYLKHIHI